MRLFFSLDKPQSLRNNNESENSREIKMRLRREKVKNTK